MLAVAGVRSSHWRSTRLFIAGSLAVVALRSTAFLQCWGSPAAFQQPPLGQQPKFGGTKGGSAKGTLCVARISLAAPMRHVPVPPHMRSCKPRVCQQEPCGGHEPLKPLITEHRMHLQCIPTSGTTKLWSDSFAAVAALGSFGASVPCAIAASENDVTPESLMQDIDRVFFWQPLIGSVLFIGTLTGIQSRASRATELRQEWATRETQLRQLQASALASGQPVDEGQLSALVAELDRLNQEELDARSVFGVMLPRGKAPAAIRMTERHGSGMTDPLMDEQQESMALVISITLLTGLLFYISG